MVCLTVRWWVNSHWNIYLYWNLSIHFVQTYSLDRMIIFTLYRYLFSPVCSFLASFCNFLRPNKEQERMSPLYTQYWDELTCVNTMIIAKGAVVLSLSSDFPWLWLKTNPKLKGVERHNVSQLLKSKPFKINFFQEYKVTPNFISIKIDSTVGLIIWLKNDNEDAQEGVNHFFYKILNPTMEQL